MNSTTARKPRKPHVAIAAGGHIGKRSRLMSMAQARGFAACLNANPRVLQAIAIPSRSDGQAYVWWLPASERVRDAATAAVQGARSIRAADEAAEYAFYPHGAADHFYCIHDRGADCDAAVYTVSEHGCTCSDYTYRCRAAGIRCKHQIALEASL